ncbi:Tether containing UBX domain for GLUT4 [Armadillidium nasatum]|uniref:Tether containing UBX domain for GLUT4 n=1 Tax=Armadillidium nasatum TaxID=96803 RepID=A0A5N5SWR6_9CRUS|nr:Tether containing UBX domain for GLUT4 [Armadillidium nasatum]
MIMRQLEKDSRLLLAMNRYPVTQIRIIFPDRLAIQANFKPRNTVNDIIDFLKPLLVRRDLNFYLCKFYSYFELILGVSVRGSTVVCEVRSIVQNTTHPRRVLDPASSLVEADCIPKALIYFGTEEDLPTYLNEESLSKKSSFDAASKSVVKSKNRQVSYESGNMSGSSIPEKISLDSREQQEGAKVKSSHKPKWFKLGK